MFSGNMFRRNVSTPGCVTSVAAPLAATDAGKVNTFTSARKMDGYSTNHECERGDYLEVQECLPGDAAEAPQASAARNSCRQRAENQWGNNHSHESQKDLRENMEMNCNARSVGAQFCPRQDRGQGPGCDRAPLDSHVGQDRESRRPDRGTQWMVFGEAYARAIKSQTDGGGDFGERP